MRVAESLRRRDSRLSRRRAPPARVDWPLQPLADGREEQLPLADLIWLPAFVGFARDAARLSGGWRALLAGD